MRSVCVVMAGLGLVLATPASADEIVEQIDMSKAYYSRGDLALALTELEFAVNALRTRFSNAFMGTLPAAPLLWSAETPAMESGAALFGGGVMVTRHYWEQKGGGQITAELMVDSPMVQAFSAMLSAPIMIATDPSLERVRFGEVTGLLDWDDDQRTGDLSLALGGRVLAKLIGKDLDDKTMLVDMMKSWDLQTVAKVADLN